MLSYYTKRSTGEGFQQTQKPHEYTSWVHGNAVTQAELTELAETYHLSDHILRDVRDSEELPRIEYGEKSELYLFLRVARITKRGEVHTSPLLVVVRGKLFFTLAYGDTFRPEELIEYDNTYSATFAPQQLACLTLAVVAAEYENLIRHTTRSVRDVSLRLKAHEVTNHDFIRFATIEDNLNEYHTNLDGVRTLGRHLLENRRQVFASNDLEMIEDIQLHIEQLLAAVASQSQSITSIRNAYTTIANNSLNQRMKTLTVLTVLIALPNVFYGMYGMNVSLPFADQPWAYTIIVIFTFLLIIGVFLLARRFKIF